MVILGDQWYGVLSDYMKAGDKPPKNAHITSFWHSFILALLLMVDKRLILGVDQLYEYSRWSTAKNSQVINGMWSWGW